MRSRQNSLPAAALFSWYLGAPPRFAFSLRVLSSSLRDMSYRPLKVGGRFSANAARPSLRSSLASTTS